MAIGVQIAANSGRSVAPCRRGFVCDKEVAQRHDAVGGTGKCAFEWRRNVIGLAVVIRVCKRPHAYTPDLPSVGVVAVAVVLDNCVAWWAHRRDRKPVAKAVIVDIWIVHTRMHIGLLNGTNGGLLHKVARGRRHVELAHRDGNVVR